MRFLEKTKQSQGENRYSRRKLDKNFSGEEEFLKRIIHYCKLSNNDDVVEIGGGLGVLTDLLAKTAKRVTVIEFNPVLFQAVKKSLKERKNITLVPRTTHNKVKKYPNKIIVNPPYSLSIPLIMSQLEKSFNQIILLSQPKIFELMVAQKKTDGYGPLAVLTSYKLLVEVLETIPQYSLVQQGHIQIAVISVKIHEPRFKILNERLFYKLTNELFTQQNKKVKKPLETFIEKTMRLEKREARLIVEELPFLETRICELQPEEFGLLSNMVFNYINSKRVHYGDRRCYVFPGVYEPAEDTFLLAKHLNCRERERVLEIGTGCGLLGILAVRKASNIVVIDINPQAVKCAKFNAKLNQVSNKISLIVGDLFGPIKITEKFDCIIFNPPYLPLEKKEFNDNQEKAWFGGEKGREIIDHFLEELDKYVTLNSRVLMIQSSLSNPEETLSKFKKNGFEIHIIAEENLFFEKIMVLEAKKFDTRILTNKKDYKTL